MLPIVPKMLPTGNALQMPLGQDGQDGQESMRHRYSPTGRGVSIYPALPAQREKREEGGRFPVGRNPGRKGRNPGDTAQAGGAL